MKNIVEVAKERRAKFDSLKTEHAAMKEKSDKADVLIAELEKVKDKLPKEAKDALDKHKKAGKKK